MNLIKKVEDSIFINAPKERVWAVTKDVEQWPEWTPTVTSVRILDDGPLKPGSIAHLKQPGQPETHWTVTEYIPDELFTWKTQFPGLKMSASHELQSKNVGTLNTLRVELNGVMVLVLWPLLKVAIQKALVKENKGLKTKCESTDLFNLERSRD